MEQQQNVSMTCLRTSCLGETVSLTAVRHLVPLKQRRPSEVPLSNSTDTLMSWCLKLGQKECPSKNKKKSDCFYVKLLSHWLINISENIPNPMKTAAPAFLVLTN